MSLIPGPGHGTVRLTDSLIGAVRAVLQTRKNLVSIGALGVSGFLIFVATAFATIAIFLATGAVQEGNPGV